MRVRTVAPAGYTHALQAQWQLSFKVFGIAATKSNMARLLVSTAATVSISALTWGNKLAGRGAPGTVTQQQQVAAARARRGGR